MDPTNVQTWNLSIQRQVAKDLLVTASYLGSETTHLWVQRPYNQALFLGLALQSGTLFASWRVHTQWRHVRHLFHHRKHESAPNVDNPESN
jgi:hypothetical protein